MSSGTGNSLAMLPFFPRDYLAATRHMSLAEHGAYCNLLWLQWENGPLPDDPERLARMLGCSTGELSAVWATVRPKFEPTDAGLLNRRLEQHRQEALRRKGRQSTGASITNAKRWGKSSPSESVSESARDTPSESVSISPPSPSPSPSPESGDSFGISRPLARPAKVRPSYEGQEFHQQVVAAYHELLPDLPKVKAWTPKRAKALNARITERQRDGKLADQVDYWRQFFARVETSDFLCGRSSDFRADLEWLLRPENFLKVIEGRYENRKGASNGR